MRKAVVSPMIGSTLLRPRSGSRTSAAAAVSVFRKQPVTLALPSTTNATTTRSIGTLSRWTMSCLAPRNYSPPPTTAARILRSFSVLVQSSSSLSRSFTRRPPTTVSLPSPVGYDPLPPRRQFTSPSELFSSLPSIWGGSGWLIKALHSMDGGLGLPYWACFVAINVLVRCALLPLVIQGAHTSSRFAKVVPEIQFLMTLFTNDWKQLRQRKDSSTWVERYALLRTNFQTLSALYKLHNIRPFAVFYSPLIQLPIFWYISVDLRKIVNGLDPQLAQALVDAPVGWIPDLTEADPWYGLPVLAGVLLYANVEVAVGKRSLAGPNASKADTGILLKDIFQSFAVFMPCFTSQMPAGVQIYVATSFLFTMGQSAALRNATFRSAVGLPALPQPGDTSQQAKYAQQFIRLKQLEQKAREIRGDGPVLGKGVLAKDFECSFPGTYRKSTIQVENSSLLGDRPSFRVDSNQVKKTTPASDNNNGSTTAWKKQGKAKLDISASPFASLPYIHGVSAPPWQLAEQAHLFAPPAKEDEMPDGDDVVLVADNDDDLMAKANQGIRPTRMSQTPLPPTSSASPPPLRKPLRVNRKSKKGGKKKR